MDPQNRFECHRVLLTDYNRNIEMRCGRRMVLLSSDKRVVLVSGTNVLNISEIKKSTHLLPRSKAEEIGGGATELLRELGDRDTVAVAFTNLSPNELKTLVSMVNAEQFRIEQTYHVLNGMDIMLSDDESGYISQLKAMVEFLNQKISSFMEEYNKCRKSMYTTIKGVKLDLYTFTYEDQVREYDPTVGYHRYSSSERSIDELLMTSIERMSEYPFLHIVDEKELKMFLDILPMVESHVNVPLEKIVSIRELDRIVDVLIAQATMIDVSTADEKIKRYFEVFSDIISFSTQGKSSYHFLRSNFMRRIVVSFLHSEEMRFVKNGAKLIDDLPFIIDYQRVCPSSEKKSTFNKFEKFVRNLDTFSGGFLEDLDLSKSFITGSAIFASLFALNGIDNFLKYENFLRIWFPKVYTVPHHEEMLFEELAAEMIRNPSRFIFGRGEDGVVFTTAAEPRTFPEAQIIKYREVPGADLDIGVYCETEDEFRSIVEKHHATILKHYPSAELRENGPAWAIDSPDMPRTVEVFRMKSPNQWVTNHLPFVRGCFTSYHSCRKLYVAPSLLNLARSSLFYNDISAIPLLVNDYRYFPSKTSPGETLLKYLQRIGVQDGFQAFGDDCRCRFKRCQFHSRKLPSPFFTTDIYNVRELPLYGRIKRKLGIY